MSIPVKTPYWTFCEHKRTAGDCSYCEGAESRQIGERFDHIGKSFDLDAPNAPWIRRAMDMRADQDFNPATSRAGVYVVVEQDRYDARAKIGMTLRGPAERMSGLRKGCPSSLRLVGWIGCPATSKTARDVEGRLHTIFAEHRIRRDSEWFYIRGDLADFIANPSTLEGTIIAPTPKPRIIRSTERPTR